MTDRKAFREENLGVANMRVALCLLVVAFLAGCNSGKEHPTEPVRSSSSTASSASTAAPVEQHIVAWKLPAEEPEADPASLSPPTWAPGMYWNYTAESGRWQNWTVERETTVRGSPAFEVAIHFSEPDDWGQSDNTYWIAANLTILKIEAPPVKADFNPPCPRIFPMVAHTDQCRVAAGAYHENYTSTLTVHGWAPLQLASGPQRAIHMHAQQTGSGGSVDLWYSPAIRYFLTQPTPDSEKEETYYLTGYGGPKSTSFP